MQRRVVVTGIGMITPIGNGKADFFNNSKKGESVVQKITAFDTGPFRTKYAGSVEYDPETVVPEVIRRQCDRCTLLGFGAVDFALKDAHIELEKIDRKRFGLVIGNMLGGCEFGENEMRNLYQFGPFAVSPYMMIAWFYAATIGQISIHYKLKGFGKTVVSDKASGTDSIGLAYEVIKSNKADIMLAGGVEAPVNPYGLLCIDQSGGTIEGDGGDHRTAYCPFSQHSQGFFPAEGAGIVVLEEREHAFNRNAPLYGEIVGYATTTDGYHPIKPRPDGKQLARAITMALDQSQIASEDLDYINTDGIGLREADLQEARGIECSLGSASKKVKISAPKSMYGHTLAAAGAIDFIETVLSVNEDIVLPTMHCSKPLPSINLDIVAEKPLNRVVNYGMSISRGFGGINSAIIVRKLDGE